MDRLLQIVAVTVVAPAVVVGLIWLADSALRHTRPATRRRLRPWVWLTPAFVLVVVFLGYPLVNTIWLSLHDADGSSFVGADNYRELARDREIRVALRNSALWLAVFVPATVVMGLAFAVLTDRVRYRRSARTIVFVPMAISMVGAATIWRFMYDYRPPGSPQTGTLNAAYLSLGLGDEPRAWLIDTTTNNLALIVVGIWLLTGFAMVVLAAALNGIPDQLLEAARVDGASEWQVFRRIKLPLIRPTLIIVSTTLFISALKIFDIVWVLTNGNFDTGVVGTEMYRQLFADQHDGRAAMIAVVLLAATAPVVVINVRNHRREARTP